MKNRRGGGRLWHFVSGSTIATNSSHWLAVAEI